MTPNRHKLHLSVLHLHGMPQQTTLSFTDDTVLGEEQFAEFVPEAERAGLAEMQCTVCWRQIGVADGGWWLVSNGQRWQCSVNDVPLAYRHSLPLHAGDRIELGMLHLEVVDVDVDQPALVQRDVVQEGNLEVAGAGTFPGAGSAANFNADPFDIVPEAVITDTGKAMRLHSSTPLLSSQDIVTRSIGSAILDGLAKDYIQAIQDPASLYTQHSMQAMPELTDTPLSTPTELAAHITRHASIEDLVSGGLEVDNLFQQSDTQEWRPPSSAPDHNVLHLFAQGIAMPEHRANLPTLTRREHHAFSPDSSYLAASASRPDTEQHTSQNSKDAGAL